MSRVRMRGFIGALVSYTALLVLSSWLLSVGDSDQGATRILLALMPVPAGVAIVVMAVRQYQAMDELMRRIHLMALSVAFLGTLLISLTWGFLEAVDVGPLGGFVVFGILGLLYLAGLVWAWSRYR